MKRYPEIAYRYLRKQSRRTFLTIVGITLSIALITAIGIIGESIKSTRIEQAKEFSSYHGTFKNLNPQQLDILKKQNVVKRIGLNAGLGVVIVPGKSIYININGYNSEAIEMLNLGLLRGKFPEKEKEIALDEWVLQELDIEAVPGKKTHLKFENSYETTHKKSAKYEGEEDFELVGVLKTHPGAKGSGHSVGIVTQETVRKLLPEEVFTYHQIFVEIKEGLPVRDALKEIKKTLGYDKEIYYNEALLSALEATGEISWPLIFLTLIITIAAAATIYNIFHISILERIRQFGILRSIGATPKQIKGIVLREALLLSLISVPLGLAVGILVASVLPYSLKILQGFISHVSISGWVLLGGAAIGILAVLISSFYPAYRASKILPLEAIRTHREVLKEIVARRKRWYSLIQYVFGITGKIAYQNLWRNKVRTIVTLFSMSLGVVLFIVFSYWVSGADVSTVTEQFIRADYVIKTHNLRGTSGLSDRDFEIISNLSGIKEVAKVQCNVSHILLPGHKASITSIFYGYTEKSLDAARKYLVAGEINIEKMSKEPIILIKDRTSNLKVGEEIVIMKDYLEDGQAEYQQQRFRIGGILKDIPTYIGFTSIGPDIVIHQNVFKVFMDSEIYKLFEINIDSGANRQLIENNLKNITKAIPGGTLISYEEELEKLREEKRQLMTLFYSLIVVIAIIGSFSIINTMSTNLILRTREFGILRAVGMTNRQLKQMIKMEGLFYGLMSSLWGSIAGSVLAYILFILMKNEATYLVWKVPWQYITFAWIGSILIGIISTYSPLKRISSMTIIDAIRTVE